MKLTWQEPGFEYSIQSIMQFQTEELNNYWIDSLYYFYPDLNKNYAMSLKDEERSLYVRGVIEKVYLQDKHLLEEKVSSYQRYWEKYEEQVTEAFSEAFDLDCKNRFEDITGKITLNPIAPRYLEEHSFDVFYLNSEKGALGMALHEIIHFVWFNVWKEHFNDIEKEYEMPHLKWILSEMTVEPIMRDPRLSLINPYFERDYEKNQNGCVYDCFYSMKIDGKPILDTLYTMYRNEKILDYMEQSYAYCQKHEKEIRSQMEEVL